MARAALEAVCLIHLPNRDAPPSEAMMAPFTRVLMGLIRTYSLSRRERPKSDRSCRNGVAQPKRINTAQIVFTPHPCGNPMCDLSGEVGGLEARRQQGCR